MMDVLKAGPCCFPDVLEGSEISLDTGETTFFLYDFAWNLLFREKEAEPGNYSITNFKLQVKYIFEEGKPCRSEAITMPRFHYRCHKTYPRLHSVGAAAHGQDVEYYTVYTGDLAIEDILMRNDDGYCYPLVREIKWAGGNETHVAHIFDSSRVDVIRVRVALSDCDRSLVNTYYL